LFEFVLFGSFWVVVVDSVIVDVLETDGGVLIESADDLWAGDAAVYDILPVFLEFVENVDWYHEGP
jgi:hypothetical protein